MRALRELVSRLGAQPISSSSPTCDEQVGALELDQVGGLGVDEMGVLVAGGDRGDLGEIAGDRPGDGGEVGGGGDDLQTWRRARRRADERGRDDERGGGGGGSRCGHLAPLGCCRFSASTARHVRAEGNVGPGDSRVAREGRVRRQARGGARPRASRSGAVGARCRGARRDVRDGALRERRTGRRREGADARRARSGRPGRGGGRRARRGRSGGSARTGRAPLDRTVTRRARSVSQDWWEWATISGPAARTASRAAPKAGRRRSDRRHAAILPRPAGSGPGQGRGGPLQPLRRWKSAMKPTRASTPASGKAL